MTNRGARRRAISPTCPRSSAQFLDVARGTGGTMITGSVGRRGEETSAPRAVRQCIGPLSGSNVRPDSFAAVHTLLSFVGRWVKLPSSWLPGLSNHRPVKTLGVLETLSPMLVVHAKPSVGNQRPRQPRNRFHKAGARNATPSDSSPLTRLSSARKPEPRHRS